MSRARAATETRGWLLHGTERCPECEQLYAYELEVRCVSCDRPYCPFCVVALRGLSRCGGCEGAGDEETAS